MTGPEKLRHPGENRARRPPWTTGAGADIRVGYQVSRLHKVRRIHALESAIRDGATLFEIFLDREKPEEIPVAEARELREMASGKGIVLQVHGSYGLEDNLGSPPLEGMVRLCMSLGADRLTVHLDDLLVERTQEIDWGMVSQGGLFVGVENTCHAGASEPEDLLAFLRTIPSDAPVGTTFDVGHANTGGRSPLKRLQDLLPGLRKIGRRIVSVHLHDNDGSGDQHKILGEGNIGFPDLLPLLVEAGADRFVIEHWKGREVSLGRARSWLKK